MFVLGWLTYKLDCRGLHRIVVAVGELESEDLTLVDGVLSALESHLPDYLIFRVVYNLEFEHVLVVGFNVLSFSVEALMDLKNLLWVLYL